MHSTVASELIRHLRGERSQVALSRRLHYRSNVVYLWEAGRKWPTASTFFTLCERVGRPPDQGLAAFLGSRPDWLDGDVADFAPALLRELRGGSSIVELAARSGFSRFSVARWLKGNAEPRLPELLAMVEATSLRGLDFVAAFVDPAELPAVAEAWAQLQAARRLAGDSPWTQVVLLALELDNLGEGRRSPERLAERLGLPTSDVEHALEVLASTGQVRQVDGAWHAEPMPPVQLGRTGRSRKPFWAQVAAERLVDHPDAAASYNLCVVSEADYQRMKELQVDFYRQLRGIVADSSPGERMVLVNLQTLALDVPER